MPVVGAGQAFTDSCRTNLVGIAAFAFRRSVPDQSGHFPGGELTSDRQLFRKHHSLGFTFLHSLVTRKFTVSGTMKGTVTKSTSDRQPLTVELCLTPWSWSTAESSAQLTELPLSATGSIEQAPLESRLVAILLAFRCDGRLLAGRKMQHSCGPSNTWDLVFPVLFRAPVEEH